MTTRIRSIAVGAAFTALILTEGVASAANEREQCAASAEHAQQLRDEGKYRRAREQILVCARDVCPGPIRSDCGKWLTEVDRDAPTVVFGARDRNGNDVPDVKVSMDGVALVDRLDGKPVLVDSGEHTFRFETKDGVTKEERVLLRAAEKARPLIASLPIGEVTSTAAKPSPNAPKSDASEKRKEEGSLVPAYIVSGIAVVGLASFGVFSILGSSEVSDLDKCKPTCAQSDVDSARAKYIVGDISLLVGVAAAGVATYMFLTRPKVSTKVQTGNTWHFDAGPVAGGAVGSFAAKF